MPAKPRYRSQTIRHDAPYPNGACETFSCNDFVNKPEFPTRAPESPLTLIVTSCRGGKARITDKWNPRDSWYVSCESRNDGPGYYLTAQSWNSRLYATAYSKFVDIARQGSAEWGMNIVQGRKALDTFVQLAVTSATTIAAIARANGAAMKWLNSHPSATPKSVKTRRVRRWGEFLRSKDRAKRRRLSNEIWLLDQVSSTLLAFRYGVAPLMSDLASTSDILSKPFEDKVRVRKSAKAPWNGPAGPENERWLGHESVVLTAIVSCSNPNLLLANRLGIINPQVWAWDATPWSFVVDWWFPIGSFLGNFTASVGLAFESASITRTRTFSSKWKINEYYQSWPHQYLGDRIWTGKYKQRTTGSLPIPLSVPYGTGLGIQRGQNALALIGQILSKKVK